VFYVGRDCVVAAYSISRALHGYYFFFISVFGFSDFCAVPEAFSFSLPLTVLLRSGKMYFVCVECGEVLPKGETFPLCKWCLREPVVGLESSHDPVVRALAAVYRGGSTPYSLRVSVDVASGRRTVFELVPWSRGQVPNIPRLVFDRIVFPECFPWMQLTE
jgi:hypothetical protein